MKNQTILKKGISGHRLLRLSPHRLWQSGEWIIPPAWYQWLSIHSYSEWIGPAGTDVDYSFYIYLLVCLTTSLWGRETEGLQPSDETIPTYSVQTRLHSKSWVTTYLKSEQSSVNEVRLHATAHTHQHLAPRHDDPPVHHPSLQNWDWKVYWRRKERGPMSTNRYVPRDLAKVPTQCWRTQGTYLTQPGRVATAKWETISWSTLTFSWARSGHYLPSSHSTQSVPLDDLLIFRP